MALLPFYEAKLWVFVRIHEKVDFSGLVNFQEE